MHMSLCLREVVALVISLSVVVPWSLATALTIVWLASESSVANSAAQLPTSLLMIFVAVAFGVPFAVMYWVRRAFYRRFGDTRAS